MNKKKIQISRNKIDQLDKKIFLLIKKRTEIVKYMLSLKKLKVKLWTIKESKKYLVI